MLGIMEVWPHIKERVRLLWFRKAAQWQISSNVTRTVAEYIGDIGEVIALVRSGAMIVQHLKTGANERFALMWKFSDWTFFCRISAFRVLGVGNRPASPQTYIIGLRDGRLAEGRPLHIARSSPGLFKHEEQVYVFGGYDGKLDVLQTEIYNISKGTWRVAAPMQFPRDGFSPCMWEEGIYLLDVGYSHRAIERFSVQTETMETLAWHLPQMLSNNSLSYIHQGTVLLLTNVGQLAITAVCSQDWRTKQIVCKENTGLSNTPPMRLGNRLYWVRWHDGDLVQLDLDALVLID